MITEYTTGNDLIEENRDFLNTNPDLAVFFFLDAPHLTETDRANYAIRVTEGEDTLMALKVEPYPFLLFGSDALIDALAAHLVDNGYEIKSILGSETVCDRFTEVLREQYGHPYAEALAMDFMRAYEKTEPSSQAVEIPTAADLDELVECQENFVNDCGTTGTVSREKIAEMLDRFRILRQDGRIVSMARCMPHSDTAMRIGFVYTRPEYRGRGLARQVVNTLKNEILDKGLTPTLNVDKKNPVSNHLYTSLGFVRVFSQGEYRPVEATSIVRAGKADAPALVPLVKQLWPEHSEESLVRILEEYTTAPESCVFACRTDGGFVGVALCALRHDYVEGCETSPVGYLEGIYVDAAHRMAGIARSLVGACEAWAKERGCTEFASDCELGNTVSLQFHLSVGFGEENRLICFKKRL